MAAPHLEFYSTNVPTAGTRVQIANTPRKVLKLWVKPHYANSAECFIGDSSVSSTVNAWTMMVPNTARDGSYQFDFTEAPPEQSTFYVDVVTNGEKVDTVFLLQ